MGCLPHPLQCTGVSHKPVWLSHTSLRLLISKKLANVEHQQSGQTPPSPHALMFHLHAATRHLAKALAMPSAPDVSGVSRSCHGTSSSLIPWVATCNHHCALQWASISLKISGSSSPMSTQAMNHHARLPQEASICLAAGKPWPPSSHLATWHTGVCGV